MPTAMIFCTPSCLPHSHNTTQSPQTRQLALQIAQTLQALESAATLAHSLGLEVFAGHGLNYENIAPVLALPYISELNIGHSIIARAVMVGLYQAIKDMQQAIARAKACL